MKHAIPHMRRRRRGAASIVNIASISSFVAQPAFVPCVPRAVGGIPACLFIPSFVYLFVLFVCIRLFVVLPYIASACACTLSRRPVA